MYSKFENYKEVRIGISYNKNNGGYAADSIIQIISEQNLNLIEIDYKSFLENDFTNLNEYKKIVQQAKTKAARFLENLDGLIIPGNDTRIDPRLYRQPLDNHPDPIDLTRNLAELALIHVAMQKGMPILGICGGHQIINVYLGGTLKVLSDEEYENQGYLSYAPVGFNPKTELSKIFFETKKNRQELQQVNFCGFSFFGAHKHAIKTLGNKTLANKDILICESAISNDSNSTNEAFESNYGSPLYSMQFHPEVGAKGMYSALNKKVSYQATTSNEITIYLKIFNAFKQAAVAFHLKKSLHSKLEKKQNNEIVDLNTENKNNDKMSFDLFSLFMNTKTTRSKPDVTRQAINFKT